MNAVVRVTNPLSHRESDQHREFHEQSNGDVHGGDGARSRVVGAVLSFTPDDLISRSQERE